MSLQDAEWQALDELEAPAPDQNPEDRRTYNHEDLEDEREQELKSESTKPPADQDATEAQHSKRHRAVIKTLTTTSYLVLFSILGTLARLGLVALTTYPGSPNANAILWANVLGSTIIGYLREDRMLFHHHWSSALEDAKRRGDNQENTDEDKIQKQGAEIYNSKKSSLHAYIGATVGFCGSLTSFADIIRDAFLALSNDFDTAEISTLRTVASSPRTRNNGYSVLAVVQVLWLQIAMSTAALQLGAHLATSLEKAGEWSLDSRYAYKLEQVFDRAAPLLGYGSWLGAILMAIWPPHDGWRTQVLFALIFAPLGCLLRFYLALLLNRRIEAFPLGTFAANILGTCALGMAWDLQHSRLGGLVGCQVLQGVIDGFCGALTTVSTWVLELKALRLLHSYVYASISVGTSFALLLVIMGSLRWTRGFSEPVCRS